MVLYERILKPLLFSLDAESAHELTLTVLKLSQNFIPPYSNPASIQRKVLGLNFTSPLGLAAGMDKDALCVTGWHRLGFGFAEVGTVTAEPQPGNPKPRLHRISESNSLMNAMGFNNAGAESLAKRLSSIKQINRLNFPIGVNIGKSRSVASNDVDAVIKDHLDSLAKVEAYADYMAINVSSPNTPGLRDWQDPDRLTALLRELRRKCRKPLLLKISPDIDDDTIGKLNHIAIEQGLNGLIATNTTISREDVPATLSYASGGVSGRLLTRRSREITALLGKQKPQEFALISVGGIDSAEEAALRLSLGADLVQLYTGLVFRGPDLIKQIAEHLDSVSRPQS